jgi:hypothetical protein
VLIYWIRTIKQNTGTLEFSEEVGLEINTENINLWAYFVTRTNNVVSIANKSFENVADLKHVE